MKVGGRLRFADIETEKKFLVLLPRNSHFTFLLIRYEHERLLHAAQLLVQASLQQRFWIVGITGLIKCVIYRCVKCHRYNSDCMQQFMADLPASRVNPSDVFAHVGLDFAGPIMLRTMVGKRRFRFKSYVVLFICFTTRAIHLEAVGDLTTGSCIAALKRFISRRGRPQEIFSDCATNFVGAHNELLYMQKVIQSENYNDTMSSLAAAEGIKWTFQPPATPHFGGLWEAGIKSMKYHLRRVIGNNAPTFEEFDTILKEIEACLNSGPLTAISSDPNDFSVLTPGHFLIGRTLIGAPDPDYKIIATSLLSRWQLMQKLAQRFWSRWSNEYLTRLHKRPKWWNKTSDIKLTDLVLIHEDNMPVAKWRLGRVTKVHPGKDGLIRVVTLRTENGEITRPIVKISPLPLDASSE